MRIESILAVKGREVRTIKPDATIGDTIKRMRAERVGAFVVSEDGSTIKGIVSDRDMMAAIADHGVEVVSEPVRKVMTEKVFTCTADDPVNGIMAAMTNRRIRHIPVVDEERRLRGIVSIGDVVKNRLDEIETEAEAMREYISGGH